MPDGLGVVESFQRRILIVRSGARLGSALTVSSARAISSAVGGCARAAADPAHTNAASPSANARAPTHARFACVSVRESTPEFLLNVPPFQFRAAIEIHREACRHVKGLEKKHADRVRTSDQEPKRTRHETNDVRRLTCRCEPEHQRY